MSKLNSKLDVIERYWPDYLMYCLKSRKSEHAEFHRSPTVDGFWFWYITDGPMGVKEAGKFYSTPPEVKYV